MTRVARSAAARSKAAPAGAKCSSACLTRDHLSWGECVKAKGLQISPAINDSYGSKQTQWDKDLNHYESAVNQGVQPDGTQRHQVDAALKAADNG